MKEPHKQNCSRTSHPASLKHCKVTIPPSWLTGKQAAVSNYLTQGKTYTMFGSDWEYSMNVSLGHQSTFIDDLQTDLNHAGIIPRSIFSLFSQLPKGYFVYCSFLQIYNEKIFDLLQDHKVPQPL